MKLGIIVSTAVLGLAFAPASSLKAVTLSGGTIPYSPAQLKRMMREAHTPDQYKAIARYFEQRQSDFSQLATDEMVEWQRRGENVSAPSEKFPNAVDVARNLYDYYASEASDAALKADTYHRFADGAAALVK